MEGYVAAGTTQSLPCHPESERSVLGAMLRSREAALLAIETLQPNDFYDPANREIYDAMQIIASSSRPIDLVTLDAELTRRGKLDAVGGAAYLIELSRSVPSAVNASAYIRIVDEKSTLRKLIAASEK
ncbi:MAG: replicative DNA helicase, partial [Clostridia bacterium]|nr:replicative DNA helicase [Clostridia bacterium]